MITPIQFKRNKQVSLGLLKCELDRRVSLITSMIKGIAPKKTCSDSCCQLQDKACQTEQYLTPLTEISNLSVSKSGSVKSLKSPPILKKQSSKSDKQNSMVTLSMKSIKPKNKNLLKSIQESEQQGLKTSRHKVDTNMKKSKNSEVNRSTTFKNSGHQKTLVQSDRFINVVKSFQSHRKENFTERKTKGNKNQTTQAEQTFLDLSLSNLGKDCSQQKEYKRHRKNSFNDSSVNSSFIIQKNDKKPNHSFTTNNNSIAFTHTTSIQQPASGLKRIAISSSVFEKIEQEYNERMEKKRNKNIKQSRTNNLRISLLKKLQDKHLKTNQQVK